MRGKAGAALGFRSGLEELNSDWLKQNDEPVCYEQHTLQYVKKPSTYKPDFILQNGIVIETKGHFVSADRAKHLLIKAQHPDLDLRFVFSDPHMFLTGQKVTEFRKYLKKKYEIVLPRKIPQEVRDEYQDEFFSTLKSKPSQTTYALWCKQKGFLYATETIPLEWMQEELSPQSYAATQTALGWNL